MGSEAPVGRVSFQHRLERARRRLAVPGGDPTVRIAILDGPVDLDHPCFEGARLRLVDSPVQNRIGTDGACEHGTHIASIVFGQPEGPVPGGAPGCTGLIVPLFRSDGHLGVLPATQEDMARAIVSALDAEADIINISAGQLDPVVAAAPALIESLDACARRGAVIVAAAGNDGCACPHVPGALDQVLVVGAMDDDGAPLPTSNWGPAYTKHGVLAPGAGILGAVPLGGAVPRSGTSYATAITSALLGLLVSEQIATTGRRDVRRAVEVLVETADRCAIPDAPGCERLLAGRLNFDRAIDALSWKEKTVPNDATNATPETDHLQSDAAAAQLPESPPPPAGEPAATPSGEPRRADSGPPASDRVDRPSTPRPDPAGPSGRAAGIEVSDKAPLKSPALVYSVGTLAHAFSSEECRESFVQAGVSDPEDPAALLAYLDEHPYAAQAVDWLVTIGATVLYSLRPEGAFAADTYQRIRDFLALQVKGKADLASFPGVLGGTTLLDGGQRVPLLVPDLRGMFSWNVERLIERAEQDSGLPETKKKGDGERKKVRSELRNFLDRIYYELRNNGLSGPDRALNYAATNAFSFLRVFWRSFLENRVLDTVGVEPSPICPPGAECYDVVLTFFDPRNRLEKAREVVRFTVDVAQVLPVLVDKPRSWFIY